MNSAREMELEGRFAAMIVRLSSDFTAKFEEYMIDVYKNARACTRLHAACEKLKKVLRAKPKASLNIECLLDEKSVKGVFEKDAFEQLTVPILERVNGPLEKALLEAGLTTENINSVDVVGSGSCIPASIRIITDLFGQAPRRTMNSSESSDDVPQTKNQKTPVLPKVATKEKSCDVDDSSEESSDVEPKRRQAPATSSSSEDDTFEDESVEEEPAKTPKKKAKDVVMADASPGKQTASKSEKKASKPPVTPSTQTTGSKTLFVGNLSFSAERPNVKEFFTDAGEVVDVEFASEEAAQKALELNGHDLLGRGVWLDLARERGSYTPHSDNDNSSYQKSGKGEQGKTIYIRGFDKSLGEDEIRSALKEHFGSGGEIPRVPIPTDYETGASKGLAYMDFSGADGFSQALNSTVQISMATF